MQTHSITVTDNFWIIIRICIWSNWIGLGLSLLFNSSAFSLEDSWTLSFSFFFLCLTCFSSLSPSDSHSDDAAELALSSTFLQHLPLGTGLEGLLYSLIMWNLIKFGISTFVKTWKQLVMHWCKSGRCCCLLLITFPWPLWSFASNECLRRRQ